MFKRRARQNDWDLMERARAHLEAGELEAAAALVDALCAVEPERDSRPRWALEINSLGVEFAMASALDHAERLFRRSLALHELAPAHSNLGLVLMQTGRALDALRGFLRAADLEPDTGRIFFDLGRCLNDLSTAEAAYQRAVDLDPADAEALFHLARLLESTGKTDDAEHAWEAAVGRFDSADAHAGYADFLYDADRHEDAEAHAHAALARDPNHALAHRVLGDVDGVRGRFEDARDHLRRALTAQPDWWDALYRLMLACVLLEDKPAFVEALAGALHFHRALAIDALNGAEHFERFRDDIDVQALLASSQLMLPSDGASGGF